ncbi:MAG: hypothetical protein IJY87_02840 [Bacilli bacterium]|nr:hypothetical protein [Bacilli bacterium]
MYRLKYYSLNKDEKKELKKNFYNTEFGKSIKNRLDRLFLIGIIGILFSVYLFINPSNKWDIVTGVILVVASIIFLVGSFKVRIKKLNDYLVKQKK